MHLLCFHKRAPPSLALSYLALLLTLLGTVLTASLLPGGVSAAPGSVSRRGERKRGPAWAAAAAEPARGAELDAAPPESIADAGRF